MSQAFTAGQVAKAAGIAYHQLNHWATLGVVVPSIQDGKGFGGVRAYSIADVVALKIVNRLKSKGFPLRHLRELAKKIQEQDLTSNMIFVCSEDGSVAAFGEQDVMTAVGVMNRGIAWFINLCEIAIEVKSSLESMARPSRGKAVRISA